MLDDRVAHVYQVTSHTIRLQGRIKSGNINGRTSEERKLKIFQDYYSKVQSKLKACIAELEY